MTLTFKAATQNSIHVVGYSPLQKGDQIDVNRTTAKVLLTNFPKDFEEIKNAIVSKNKLLQKTATFKSK